MTPNQKNNWGKQTVLATYQEKEGVTIV